MFRDWPGYFTATSNPLPDEAGRAVLCAPRTLGAAPFHKGAGQTPICFRASGKAFYCMKVKTPGSHSAQLEKRVNTPQVLAYQLKDDGNIPNNPKLPLLIYEGAFKLPANDPASTIEKVFSANGWSGSWRDGIYPFHHYHSTTHEVLGVFSGSAMVQLGGPRGITQTVRAGDVVIIPAGVAHKNLGATVDFGVVGAYPGGHEWDMNYGNAGERPAADHAIARVPLPRRDPVYGTDGPLFEHWLE